MRRLKAYLAIGRSVGGFLVMFAKVWFIGMTIGGLFTLGYVLFGWIVWFVVNVAMPWIEK